MATILTISIRDDISEKIIDLMDRLKKKNKSELVEELICIGIKQKEDDKNGINKKELHDIG